MQSQRLKISFLMSWSVKCPHKRKIEPGFFVWDARFMDFFPTSEMSTQFHLLLLFPGITVNIYYLFLVAHSSKISTVPSLCWAFPCIISCSQHSLPKEVTVVPVSIRKFPGAISKVMWSAYPSAWVVVGTQVPAPSRCFPRSARWPFLDTPGVH